MWADLPPRFKPPKSPKAPPILATLALAKQFQRLLDTGEARNRAALALRYELSRPRITQIMKLLTLAPEVVAHIETTKLSVSERALRPVFAAPCEEQLRFVQAWRATTRPPPLS